MSGFMKLIRGAQALSSQLLRLPYVGTTLPAQTLNGTIARTFLSGPKQSPLLSQAIQSQTNLPGPMVNKTWNSQPVRTKIYISRTTGGPRTVTAVTQRFFRLHNGQWIRPQSGRRKRLWAKTNKRAHRLQDHLVCTKAQSQLLDRMVGRYFKKPRHYPDDPYAPYHKFENLPQYKVLKDKPKFLP